MLGVCFSNGGDAIDACGGSGGSVAVGVIEGVSSINGVAVAVTVEVNGTGVTGRAVGTGPSG